MRYPWLCALALAAAVAAQTPAPAPPAHRGAPIPFPHGGTLPADQAQQELARLFGPDFVLDSSAPAMTADLDSDGQEDLVLVATGKDPMLDQADFHYTVIDPYDAYFGYGNPKVTLSFAINMGKIRFVLVAHAWRSDPSKGKYVIVNLPFDKISVGRMLVKKKGVDILVAEESGGLIATVFWDGRKYRWEPSDSGQ